MRLKFWKTLAAALLLVSGSRLEAAPFTAGNLAVIQAAASANNTTMSVVEVNLSGATPTTPVQTITIPGTGTNAFRISGSATSTGYLSTTADRSLLTFTGANNADTTANVNTLNPRAVGTLDASGSYNIATTYTGSSGNQTRSATSLDNSTWYIADQGGVYTNGATAASPVGNLRGIKTFGGEVYTGQASSTATTIAVNKVSAATGGTVTGLPGLINNANLQDFYLISSGSNGSAFDVLYTLSATSNTAGTIAKFSFDFLNNTWVTNGTATTTVGGFGLAAADFGSGANLYLTTGQGAQTANSLLAFNDSAGYNTAIALGTSTTLYTAPTGTILKGVEFAPAAAAAVPEPSTMILVGLGLAGVVFARRRRG
jgi:hypothetical protein